MPTQTIPNWWKKVRLGEVYNISSWLWKWRKYFWKWFPFLSYKTIFNNFFVPEKLEDLVDTTLEEQEKFSIRRWDVFLTRTSEVIDEVWMSCVALKDYPTATFNWFSKRLRPKKGIDILPEYIAYFFRSDYFRNQVSNVCSIITRASLNNEILNSLSILLPPLPVQRKVASILSAYDELIENNNKRIKILESMGEKGLQMILSEDDQKIEEKSILEENQYFRFVRENVKKFDWDKIYYATADIDWINIVWKWEKINYENKPSRAQKQPVINSVWFARMIDTYKVLVFSDENKSIADNILLSSWMVWFQATNDIYLPFLFWTINSKDFHKIKDSYCTGATQRALTNDWLKMIKIKFPAKENIIKFWEFAKSILDEILNLQLQNQNLKQTRDLLIPQLVSGKLDVDKMEI